MEVGGGETQRATVGLTLTQGTLQMDALYEDLFSYLDHNGDGTVNVLEFKEDLKDLGVINSLEDDQVVFMKFRLMSGL